MLKNIWYCIKKTSEWYFALLVLYIILTLVNATIPILSAFLPKLVIEKLTLGSDIKGLIGTIMVFMGSIAVLTGVSKFLTKYLVNMPQSMLYKRLHKSGKRNISKAARGKFPVL